MKLINIRFTSWRDQSVPPRTIELRAQLDALTMRERALIAAVARVKKEQGHDNGVAQSSLAKINEDLQIIQAERTFLFSAEKAAAHAEARAAIEHPKVGTFGYQVLSERDHRVAMVVDETGKFLPSQVSYTYDIVDEDPPLPQWAKDGKFGH